MKSYDTNVLIVGGGPAGAHTAKRLSQAGIDNILVERDCNYCKPCGGGVNPLAFDEFDIPKNLIKKRVSSIRIVSPSKRSVHIPLAGGYLAIVDRYRFDATLRELAVREGTNLIEGSFRGLVYTKGGPVATVQTKDGTKEIRAGYVVAADGVNSILRKSAPTPARPHVFTLSTILPDKDTETCEFWFGSSWSSGFYAWVFPHHNGLSIGISTLNYGIANELFQSFLQARGIDAVRRARGYYIPVWDDKIYYHNKIFFVGDAAGQVLPMSLEGIYYALSSAESVVHAVKTNKPHSYRSHWRSKHKLRFLIMTLLHRIYLRNDRTAEKLISMQTHTDIQRDAMGIWLRKFPKNENLFGYLYLMAKFIGRSL